MTNYNKEEAEILRRESERTSKYPIDYRMYDTSLEGYVVIPVKPKENEEAILTELGYVKVSQKEIEATKGLQRYRDKLLYKIPWKTLKEIHS